MADLGRPTDYKEEYNELAFKFALLGATDKQLANFFDVCEDTIYEWKKVHPHFSEALKKGKDRADAEIANALYHRAKGYSHEEEKIFQYEGSIIKTDTVRHYPPDTAAAFIWLKNRQGSNWKDRKDPTAIFENAEDYFKTIADAITQSDTNPD